MKTLGQLLVERRKARGFEQKQLAALIKNRDGKPLSAAYLNHLEHDHGKPPNYLLDQLAEVLKVERDVLYFWARRIPADIQPSETDAEQVAAAYRVFRRELNRAHNDRGGA